MEARPIKQVTRLSNYTERSPCKAVSFEPVLKSPVGSRNRPTFEVGEMSTKWSLGLEFILKTHSPVQAFSDILQGSTKTTLDYSIVPATEISILCEKNPATSRSSNLHLSGGNWFIQLRDGGRMEIMGLAHSSWDFVRSVPSEGLRRWSSRRFEFRSILPTLGEEDLGDSLGVNHDRSVMVVDDSLGALVIEPLAVDFSMVEQVSFDTPRLVNSKNDPIQHSDWVMGQLKKIGKALSALYDGNEEVVMTMLKHIEARKTQEGKYWAWFKTQ